MSVTEDYHLSKFKVNGADKYLEVLPGTDHYKRFLIETISCEDFDTLMRIQGNTQKAVHIIDGDHYYAYFRTHGVNDRVIVVSRGLFRRWNRLEDGRYFDWQGQERPIPKNQGGWVEVATYSSYEQMIARIFKNQIHLTQP